MASVASIQKFEIALEHDIDQQYQHLPGEKIQGDVILDLLESVTLKAINVQITGEANVSLDKSVSTANCSQVYEVYIDHTIEVLKSETEFTSLASGRHKFAFEYRLPESLPSSFIGRYGSVTYVIKATLKEQRRFSPGTTITSEPFLVLRKLDIESDKSLVVPHTKHKYRRFSKPLCFCMSGKVTAVVTVNRLGHLPGDAVIVDATIENHSPLLVEALQVALVMTSIFRCRKKVSRSSQIIQKKREDWELGEGEGRMWKEVRLQIPQYIPESRLDGCDIMDIHYELAFRVEIKSGRTYIETLDVNIPLTIGTRSRDRDIGGTVGETWNLGADYQMGKMGGNQNYGNGYGTTSSLASDLQGDAAKNEFRHPLKHGDTRQNPLFEGVD